MTEHSRPVTPPAAAPPPAAATGPSLLGLFRVWSSIGLQSFGGGASTTLLIQRAFIERAGWLTNDEFLRIWSLGQITPGISLIAVTALIGKRLGGARGVVVSLAGMLLPSGTITCLLAALFVAVERSATTQAVLRGVIPATGGVMALVLVNFARPVVSDALRGSRARALLYLILTLLGAALVIVLNVSAIFILIGMALLGAFAFAPRQPEATEVEPAKPAERGEDAQP